MIIALETLLFDINQSEKSHTSFGLPLEWELLWGRWKHQRYGKIGGLTKDSRGDMGSLGGYFSYFKKQFAWSINSYKSATKLRVSDNNSSLFLYICPSVHPSVHSFNAHHISVTIYHVFMFLLHMCKIMISSGVFFIFFKLWFFGLLGEMGGKRAKK